MPSFTPTRSSSHASKARTLAHDEHSTPQSYILPPPQRFDSPFQSDLEDTSAHDLSSQRSPKRSRRLSRPPTAGGGPLSSHPTDDDEIPAVPGAFPSSSSPIPRHDLNHDSSRVMSSESTRETSGSFAAPTSPTTAPDHHQPRERRPSTVRRLFSLSSLRQSFSSSRTSFSIPPSSSYGTRDEFQARPQSPGATSITASTAQAPSMYSARPSTLRRNRTSSWFKRKSGIFSVNEQGMLDLADADSQDARQAKRMKDSNRLPMLPEVSTLLELNEGSLGWDDEIFKK